ncbi:GTPase domain-containing protein [Clostridium muellerianum]|nr:GTPase domain-containing protein [Clostridium muellerianum]
MGEVLEKVVKVLASVGGTFVGIVEGFIKCSYSYFKGIKYISYNKYSLKAKEEFDEPAEEKYFFYKQYEDLKNDYLSAAAINKGNILVYKKMKQENHCGLGRLKGAVASIYVFGNIFNGIYFFIHFIIITIISSPVYILYFIIKNIENVRSNRENTGTICTHCYSKFNIPYYLCPNCGRIHKSLVPGPYGIIKRKCICGKEIPSTNMSGRHKLSAVCPVCLSKVEIKEMPSACIAIIGGEDSGKTSFIHSVIHDFFSCISKENKRKVEFLNSSEEESFNSMVQCTNNENSNLEALKEHKNLYNVFMNSETNSSKKILYIYDNKGENFNSISGIMRQKYYKYVDGVIFMIDPLCIDKVIECDLVKNEAENYIKKDINIDDLLDRFIIGMKKLCGIKADEIINIPIAVVINKMDLINYNGTAVDFLKLVREEKFIRKVQYNFLSSEFFFTNNLNSISNKTNAVEPMEWILSKA